AFLLVSHLLNILRHNYALDVVDYALVNGYAREGLGAQELDQLFHGHVSRHSDHVGTRFHGFPHRLAAELHHRLDEVAIAFVQNALFLTDRKSTRLNSSY